MAMPIPELLPEYPVCSSRQKSFPIDPGDYNAYWWFYQGNLVSEEPKFSPTELGYYELLVANADGCTLTAIFEAYDGCSFDIVFPDAMILGDPGRDFFVTVSKSVKEVELSIYNRLGILIHHESSSEIFPEKPFLTWDGKSKGQWVPIGTYVVSVVVRNPDVGLEEKRLGSLLIIN